MVSLSSNLRKKNLLRPELFWYLSKGSHQPYHSANVTEMIMEMRQAWPVRSSLHQHPEESSTSLKQEMENGAKKNASGRDGKGIRFTISQFHKPVWGKIKTVLIILPQFYTLGDPNTPPVWPPAQQSSSCLHWVTHSSPPAAAGKQQNKANTSVKV